MKINSASFVKGIRGSDAVTVDGKKMIAFVGRSNVGKSSLVNVLANKKDLVKVSGRPGKTTEINFFLINDSFYFVDLPGYGYARVSPEEKEKLQKLIVWYLTTHEFRPAVVVVVLDSKVGLTQFDREMIEILQDQNHRFVLAANKSDKLTFNQNKQLVDELQKDVDGAEVVSVSAEKKTGIKELLQKISLT